MCEEACPTDEAAIRILPAKLVQGKIGKHYRLGWTIDTPVTQDFVPGPDGAAGSPAPSPSTWLDYLNEDGL
jgi:ferredoxin-type protein NapG